MNGKPIVRWLAAALSLLLLLPGTATFAYAESNPRVSLSAPVAVYLAYDTASEKPIAINRSVSTTSNLSGGLKVVPYTVDGWQNTVFGIDGEGYLTLRPETTNRGFIVDIQLTSDNYCAIDGNEIRYFTMVYKVVGEGKAAEETIFSVTPQNASGVTSNSAGITVKGAVSDGAWNTVCCEAHPFNTENGGHFRLQFNGLSESDSYIVIDYFAWVRTAEEAEALKTVRAAVREAVKNPITSTRETRAERGIAKENVIYFDGYSSDNLAAGYLNSVFEPNPSASRLVTSGITFSSPSADYDEYEIDVTDSGHIRLTTKQLKNDCAICVTVPETALSHKTDEGTFKYLSMRYRLNSSVAQTEQTSSYWPRHDGNSKSAFTYPAGDGWQMAIGQLSAWDFCSEYFTLYLPAAMRSVGASMEIDYIGFFDSEEAARTEFCRQSVADGTDIRFAGVQSMTDGDNAAIRLVGTVNSLVDANGMPLYEAFGFEVTANGKANKIPIVADTVYTSILADGEQVTAESLGTTYLFTYVISGMSPAKLKDISFTVTPYAYVDGVKVIGATDAFHYDPLSNRFLSSMEIALDEMTYVDGAFVGSLDDAFETRRTAILNAESRYAVSGEGQIYYVSNNGDDSRDGLSPETAWKTIGKLNVTTFAEGSVVLFERGGVWNKQGILSLRRGVTYSAYGNGAKPILSNHADASSAGDWIQVQENIWVYNGAYETNLSPHSDQPLYSTIMAHYPDDPSLPGSYITSIIGEKESEGKSGQEYLNSYYFFRETSGASEDVGNIIFTTKDGKTGWGVKMLKYNRKDYCTPLGPCPTGFDGITVTRGTESFTGGKDLKQNFEFYHDPNECRVYLYYDGGNPGEVFADIKLVLRGNCASAANGESEDITVDNIAFLYSGVNGMTSNGAKNLTVRNCEIGWCGGSIQMYGFLGRDDPTRYGEGVMNWGDCDGFFVLNNYFYQVFDGAISSQQSVDPGLSSCIMKNYTVEGNVSEYCSLTFESWMNLTPEQSKSGNFKFVNWLVTDNLIRRTGYGFGYTRTDDTSAPMSGSMGWPPPVYENVRIAGNTIWDFDDFLLTGLDWHIERYCFSGNTVVHPYGGELGSILNNPNLSTDSVEGKKDIMYYYTVGDIRYLLECGLIGENRFCFTLPSE